MAADRLRARLRRLMANTTPVVGRSEQGQRKQFATYRAALNHPLFLTVVGFVFTGIGGTIFANYLDTLSKRHEAERSRHTHAVNAVIELSNLINERRTRAVLVASALNRQASPKELEARKAAYDEIYVRWNSEVDGLLLRIRDQVLRQVVETDYERYLDALTHQMSISSRPSETKVSARAGYLTLIDSCVTHAFDEHQRQEISDKTRVAIAVLKDCRLDDMHFQLIRCSKIMMQSLYNLVNTPDPRSIEKTFKRDAFDIMFACDPNASPT